MKILNKDQVEALWNNLNNSTDTVLRYEILRAIVGTDYYLSADWAILEIANKFTPSSDNLSQYAETNLFLSLLILHSEEEI